MVRGCMKQITKKAAVPTHRLTGLLGEERPRLLLGRRDDV